MDEIQNIQNIQNTQNTQNTQKTEIITTNTFTHKIKSAWKNPIIQVGLFLPLIIMMSGDLAIMLANQVLIIVNLNLQIFEIGVIIGIQYIITGVFTFIFGFLSDKWSRQKLLIFGGLSWAFASLLTSYSWNFGSLLIFRMIASMGLGVQGPVTFSILSDLFPSERRSNSFAWWGIASLIGSLGAGGLALAFNKIPTAELDKTFSTMAQKISYISTHYAAQCNLWRMPYLYLAVLGLIFVGLTFLVREPKRGSKDKQLKKVLENEEVDYSKNYKIKLSDLKYLVVRKTNIILVFNFFSNITSGVIVSYLFTYVTLELGFSLDFSDLSLNLIFLMIGLVIAILIALWGQFYFARLGDKKMRNGDIRGRIKMLIYCSIFQIPFLALAFYIAPSVGTQTILKGAIHLSSTVFWVMIIIMFVLIGIGLAGSFGGTPNWYASLIDGNPPEQRGTMIAVATLMDTIGRALGAFLGGYFFGLFTAMGNPAPIGTMIVVVELIFGTLSAVITIPALFTSKKDLTDVQNILSKRAKELEKIAEEKEKN